MTNDLGSHLYNSQILDWAVETFGQVALNADERAMRVVEEAIELAQSAGLSAETIGKIQARVFSRPSGDVPREVGQVAMTLKAFAESRGLDAEYEAAREFDRVRAIPKAEWDRRHAAKTGIGITADKLKLSEEWLKGNGFGWHQIERQPDKHWVLWLGHAIDDRISMLEDLGIELAPTMHGDWFCWLRSDAAGRYHRFIHLRHLTYVDELTAIIGALVGRPFDAAHAFAGTLFTPRRMAERIETWKRMDLQMLQNEYGKWYSVERDDTRGRALPEHLEHHAKTVINGKVVRP